MEYMRIGYYRDWNTGYVREFLDQLKEDGQRKKAEPKLRYDLDVLEAFWPNLFQTNITVKILKGYEPLWELKREYQGIAYRIFFCVRKDEIWLLHAIEKKEQKTPKNDLELAYRRMKDIVDTK